VLKILTALFTVISTYTIGVAFYIAALAQLDLSLFLRVLGSTLISNFTTILFYPILIQTFLFIWLLERVEARDSAPEQD
jgi:hypothetical protein